MTGILQKAPEFKAPAVVGHGEFKDVALADFKGRWVVLFFYPNDFSYVCPTELIEFSRRSAEFEALGAQLVAVSCDSVYSHKAWLEHSLGDLAYPLVSDFNKEIATSYGVLLPEGYPTRATFILDAEGVIQYAGIHNPRVGRSVTETLRVLEASQTNRLTPVDWKRGDDTLGQ